MTRTTALQLTCLFVLLAPAGAHAQELTNQNLFDTGPYLPEHYARRLDAFKAQSPVEGGILFLGDSITEGGDWDHLLGDSTAINRGIGGDVSFGVLERIDEVLRHRPSKLFLMIGINDIGKDIPEAVIADNVRQIAARIKDESPGTQVYVQSVLPVNPRVPDFPQHYAKEHQVIRLNLLLREAADAAGATFVNLYPAFLDDLGLLDARLTTDGLHLNEAGYERWVEQLRALQLL